MNTLTDREVDEWIAIANAKPDKLREMIKEHHTLKQGLCWQVLLVPTGADDWVERSIAAGQRLKRAEYALRKLVYEVENSCATARNDVRDTTCLNCTGSGKVGDNSCCICNGTGLRRLA